MLIGMIDRNARVNLINPIFHPHQNKRNKKKKKKTLVIKHLCIILSLWYKRYRNSYVFARSSPRTRHATRRMIDQLTDYKPNYPVDRPALPRDVTNVHPAKRENVFHPVVLRWRTSWSRVEIKCRRDTNYTHALTYAITSTHMHTYMYIRTYEPRYRHNHPSIEWHMRKFLMPR